MTTFFRNWLGGTPAADPAPTISTSSPPLSDDEDDGDRTETEMDNDIAPAFPAINSSQRAYVPQASGLMAPPPLPSRLPPTSSSLGVPSGAGSLAPPPTTTKAPTKSKKREKVALAPGHSPLDWARLKSSGEDLRGVDTLMRIPPSVLKRHNKRDDAWSAFNGKVYNITHYLAFHPGGEKELMRVAGRDGTKLFAATHAWVNADFMLDTCMVGFLVPEPSS